METNEAPLKELREIKKTLRIATALATIFGFLIFVELLAIFVLLKFGPLN